MPTLLLMAALAAAGLLASAPAMLNLAAQAERDWQLASDDRNRDGNHFMSWNHLALAENLSPEHGFASFYGRRQVSPDQLRLTPYHRFPVLGHLLIKLATLPFPDDAAARVDAARTLMLAFFAGAGALAWLGLRRLALGPPVEDLGRAPRPEWPLLAAVLLAFSSHHALYYADLVATEGAMDLFALMLAFHGVAVFAIEGRFGQLLAKVTLALLLGWHVFALVGPLALLGLGAALRRRNWRSAGRYFALGAVAILLGAALVGVNLARERAVVDAQGVASVLAQPTSRSALARLGIKSAPIDWATFAQTQLYRLALATVPYAIGQVPIGDAEATPENWEVLPHSPGFEVAGGVLLLTTLGLAAGAAGPWPRGAGRRRGEVRLALVALALAGPCWAVVMRHNTAPPYHAFEGLFHIGVAVVFFALTLPQLVVRGARAGIGLGAGVVLAVSAAASAWAFNDPPRAATARALAADFDAINAFAEDETVLYPPALPWMVSRYLLRASVQVAFEDQRVWHRADFAIAPRLAPGGVAAPTLTPANRWYFLYSRAGFEDALRGYAKLAAERPPQEQAADFDLHYLANAGFADDVLYVRHQCPTVLPRSPRFFLHVHPVDASALRKHHGRSEGYDQLAFSRRWFWRQGERCYALRRLPDFAIASVHTGQFNRRKTPSGAGLEGYYEFLWAVRLRPPASGEALHP